VSQHYRGRHEIHAATGQETGEESSEEYQCAVLVPGMQEGVYAKHEREAGKIVLL
jgi:hypothetical protein